MDYIIELLRAIDIIKKKVLQPPNSTNTSSRASVNREEKLLSEKDEFDKNRVFDTNIDDIRQELNESGNGCKTGVELTSIIKKVFIKFYR